MISLFDMTCANEKQEPGLPIFSDYSDFLKSYEKFKDLIQVVTEIRERVDLVGLYALRYRRVESFWVVKMFLQKYPELFSEETLWRAYSHVSIKAAYSLDAETRKRHDILTKFSLRHLDNLYA